MMDINPSDLRYFFEVAQSLNISRAAERLDVGQPTVSQAIHRIERILGIALFDRYKTGVRLTAAGQSLLRDGRTALEAWEQLKSAAQSSEIEIKGRYSIGCHTAVASYALPKFMKPLLAAHPNLEINFKHGLSREITADVIDFKIDFGLVMNSLSHPDLVIKPVCEDKVSFWKSAGGLKDVLIFDPALSQSQALIKKIKKHFQIRRHITSSSLEVIAILAASGCGIGILPERVASIFPKLHTTANELLSVRDQLSLIYRADRTFNASARVIVDAILRTKF